MPDSKLLFISIGRDTDRDLVLRNVAPNGPMQLIPPAKDCTPVRISFPFNDGVMNAVHPRCDEHKIEKTLQPDWQPPVGMVKQGGTFETNEKPEEDHGMNTEEKGRQT